MSEILEILGEKKFSGSKNVELKSRVVFEESKKIKYENNLFYDISQQTQYINEKKESNKFRLYGKINPIMNFNVTQETLNGADKLINIDKTLFDFNLNNWSLIVLKSKRLESGFDFNGNQKYVKGIKKLDKRNGSDVVIDVDFYRGLPGRVYTSKNVDNFCIQLPLGHNFKVRDKVKIDSLNTTLLNSNVYTITNVIGDLVFINTRPIVTTFREFEVTNKNVEAKDLNDYIDVKTNNDNVQKSKTNQNLRNLNFTRSEIDEITNVERSKIQPMVRPDFYLSKLIEKERLEYYIKTLEVISIIDDLDTCGYSVNNYNQLIYNFFNQNDLDINNLVNNLNEPLSDIFIGIIKNGSPLEKSFSNVESHFNRYIEHVSDGYGIELITKKGTKPKIGDVYMHSLCEYSTENLVESEITNITHRLIHNNVLFKYDPFVKVNLKLKSPYIESGDDSLNKPEYAVYSREREKYIWRDIFDVGITDEDGNVIDFPFTNNAFYVFSDIAFKLLPEVKFVKKYNLKINDITSENGNQFGYEFDDIFKDVGLDDNQIGVKPYNQYSEIGC
jgi:hypothetical protein